MTLDQFIERYQKVPVVEQPNTVLVCMPAPLVSVKVSTYQHAAFIKGCLDGILMQETSFPFEIVIGEDESNDGTREICMEYADRHPDKIRLFLHSRANNIRINARPSSRFQSTYTRFMCRGKYVALCEGDDYWTDPHKLQKQVMFLEQNPEYVLTCGGFERMEDGLSTTVIATNPGDYVNQAHNGFAFDFNDRREDWLTKTLTVVYRRNPQLPFELAQYKYARDAHLYYHLLKKGTGFYFQEVLGVYNVHEGGVYSSADRYERITTRYLVYTELYDVNKDPFSRYKAFKAHLDLMKLGVSRDEGFYASICRDARIALRACRFIRSGNDCAALAGALRFRFSPRAIFKRMKVAHP